MNEIAGKTAGDIWKFLKDNGPTTALKLKSALNVSNGLLHLGLGWLAREDKIDIAEHEHTLMISLKSNV